MSRETPIEDYKVFDGHKHNREQGISFDNGIEREATVLYAPRAVYVQIRDTDYDPVKEISMLLRPDQAEAYATLLMYAAKVAREKS